MADLGDVAEVIDAGEHLAGGGDYGFAGSREGDTAATPGQQRRIQLLLQGAYLLADRGDG